MPDSVWSLTPRAHTRNPFGRPLQRSPFPTKWRLVFVPMKLVAATDSARVTGNQEVAALLPGCRQSGSYRAVVRIPLGGVSLHLSQVGQKPHTYRTGLGSAWYSPKSFIKGDDRHVDVSLAFGNGVLRLKLSALGV